MFLRKKLRLMVHVSHDLETQETASPVAKQSQACKATEMFGVFDALGQPTTSVKSVGAYLDRPAYKIAESFLNG